MKKLLLIVMCAVCVLTVSAQRIGSSSASSSTVKNGQSKATVGLRSGINISSFGGDWDLGSRIGFNFGVVVDAPLVKDFYLQSGLFVTQKGGKEKEDGVEMEVDPIYLQIPVLASFRYNFNSATQLQINFGPYFAYGISGDCKISRSGGSDTFDFFGDDDDQFGGKRFEAGLQIGAGVTINKFYIGGAYEFGLTDASKISDYSDDMKGKNSNFMINVGYNF